MPLISGVDRLTGHPTCLSLLSRSRYMTRNTPQRDRHRANSTWPAYSHDACSSFDFIVKTRSILTKSIDVFGYSAVIFEVEVVDAELIGRQTSVDVIAGT